MTNLLKEELDYFKNKEESPSRKTFDLSQMTAVEQEINKSEKLSMILKKRADAEEAKVRAHQYIKFVFDEIESHSEGSGVTIFMPHVITRDLYKKVIEIGDGLRLTPRERRTAIVTAEHLKIINYEQENMPQVLFDHIQSKEVFMVCWKIPDEELEPVECKLHFIEFEARKLS